MNKKVIILTASYWAWHNIAADTLSDFYKWKWYDIKIIDLVDFISFFIWKTTQNFYQNFCSKYPKIWELTYNFLDIKIIKNIIFWFKYPFYQNKFDKIISEYNPDIILSVFPFWGGFIKHNIKNFWKKYKTWIIITDAIKIHSIWYLKWKYIDKYFVIDNFSKEEFIKKFKHKTNNLIVSFFPIKKSLFLDKSNINNKSIYILLTWVSYTYMSDLLDNFIKSDYKIVIIKWRNDYLFNKLKLVNKYIEFSFINFINLRENYNNIWLFIWKAWGATISECIWTDTPIIIPVFIPGQEEWNVKLVEKYNVWFYEKDGYKTSLLIKNYHWNDMLHIFKDIKKNNNLELIYNWLN